MTLEKHLRIMQRDWDARAIDNARYYVASGSEEWTDEEFFATGRLTVEAHILSDMTNICQGKDPKQMQIIEIGCGVGRITHTLAKIFGEVHAVDVSGEMIAQAKQTFAGVKNAYFYKNNGMDLAVLPSGSYDFVFSTIVFQHISSREVIYNYVRDAHRLLRSGGLFKFDVQGDMMTAPTAEDTWLGVPFSDADALAMAEVCGFEPRYRVGAGQQNFWLWFFKP